MFSYFHWNLNGVGVQILLTTVHTERVHAWNQQSADWVLFGRSVISELQLFRKPVEVSSSTSESPMQTDVACTKCNTCWGLQCVLLNRPSGMNLLSLPHLWPCSAPWIQHGLPPAVTHFCSCSLDPFLETAEWFLPSTEQGPLFLHSFLIPKTKVLL